MITDDTTPKDKWWKSDIEGFNFPGYINTKWGRLSFEEIKELYEEVLRREQAEA